MSRPVVRTATAGSLALALALALPAAALAVEEDDRGRSDAAHEQAEERRAEGRSTGEENSDGKANPQPDGEREAGSQGETRSQAASENGSGSGSQSKAGSNGSSEGRSGSSGREDEGRAAGGDPRGNNGTIKIDGQAFDDGLGNEPHVSCTFQVDFYGFDAGDTATITFNGQAPTGGGLLHSESRTISTDAAGGGQDRDATLTYSLDDQLSELRSVAPDPQQGWHVQLAVDVDDAPGGAKQKVFWISCPTSTPPATAGTTDDTAVGGSGEGTTSPNIPESEFGGTTTSPATGGTTTVTEPTFVAAGGPVVPTTIGGTTEAAAQQEELTLGSGETTPASAEESLGAQGSRLPSALPFTGTAALLYLLGLGASAVGVGAVAHRLGRKEAETS